MNISESAALARRKYRQDWAKKHPDRVKEYARQWRHRNPEKVKAAAVRYWENKAAKNASIEDAESSMESEVKNEETQ